MLPQYFFPLWGKYFPISSKYFFDFILSGKIILIKFFCEIGKNQSRVKILFLLFPVIFRSLCDSLSKFSLSEPGPGRQEANQADLKLVTLIILANSGTKQVSRLPCHLLPSAFPATCLG